MALMGADKELIPDPIVEKAIREKLKKPTGKFSAVDLIRVKNLNLRDKGLTDIR